MTEHAQGRWRRPFARRRSASAVVVDVALLVPARSAAVSAVSGEPGAQPVRQTASSAPAWPWLLLLGGPLGWLLLLVFYDRMREHREVWVPLVARDLARSADARRWARRVVVLSVVVVVTGALVSLASMAAAGGVASTTAMVGPVIALGAVVVSWRLGRPIRLVLQPGGGAVVVHRPAPEWVAELDRRFG